MNYLWQGQVVIGCQLEQPYKLEEFEKVWMSKKPEKKLEQKHHGINSLWHHIASGSLDNLYLFHLFDIAIVQKCPWEIWKTSLGQEIYRTNVEAPVKCQSFRNLINPCYR